VSRPGVRVSAWSIAAVCGVAVAVVSVALVDTRNTAYVTTYGGASTSFAVLEALTGVALLAVALILLVERFDGMLGALTLVLSAASFAPVWVGWNGGPALPRSLGLVVASLPPALVLAVAAWLPRTGLGTTHKVRVLAGGALALTAALSFAVALVRDPIRDLYCWSDCTTNAFLVHDDAALAGHLVPAVLSVSIACGLLAVAVCCRAALRASQVTLRAVGPALAGATVAGLAFAAYAAALWYDPRELPHRPLYGTLFVARSVGLLLLAVGLGWIAVRSRLVRRLVAHLAVDLERTTGEGGLALLLATALGDPALRVGYPLGSAGRVVDLDGRPLNLDSGRILTTIVDEAGPVALVESDVASVADLERELGPAAHLALGNERLRAEALARLDDAMSSRRRTVETADAARRRMERDLHDGAQQRMLALTYDLRVALEVASSSSSRDAPAAALREAVERATAASHDLREVAHGIFPAELTTSGLEAALELLADVRPLTLSFDLPSGSPSRAVSATAYAVVAEATEDVDAAVVSASEMGGALLLTIDGDADWSERLVRLEDRVAVVGGSVRVSGRRLEATLPLTS